MPKQEQLQSLLDAGINTVFARVKFGTNDLVPILLVDMTQRASAPVTRQIIALPMDLGNEEAQAATFFQLGKGYFDRQEFPCCAVLVCKRRRCLIEANILPQQTGREEVVVAMAAGLDGRKYLMARMPLTRGENGQILPGEFSAAETVKTMIPLAHFYRGFYAQAQHKLNTIAKERGN